MDETLSTIFPGAVGTEAPDFTLKNEQGEDWTLSGQRGKIVLLLFYPGSETLVCTKQLCSVRDRWDEYLKTGAEVVGISPGTSEEHRRFAENHNLPFTLLADPNREITKTYLGAWSPLRWAMRLVVVVDALGIVRHHRVMVRAFRPNDKWSLAAIRMAQYQSLTKG
ncbi:MAG: peroxiredoxin [Pyrinomonadaceae bacterium MAG19_C2-C3]|nr:peroxiredoxin [Pyrinomonadaceae bacterium MAG19_C2-C3]